MVFLPLGKAPFSRHADPLITQRLSESRVFWKTQNNFIPKAWDIEVMLEKELVLRARGQSVAIKV